MKKYLTGVLIVIVFFCVTLSIAQPREFSALIVTKSARMTQSMRMYFKEKKSRMEMQGNSRYNILREDKQVMWMVMPDEKKYMEMPFKPFKPQEKPQIEKKIMGEVSRAEIGAEVIDGHPTKKYEITYKSGDRTDKMYQWLATDLNFPIKTAAIDGSWSTEFKDIKIGHQPDSLFEPPAGYEKVTMPSFPGMGEGMTPAPRGRNR